MEDTAAIEQVLKASGDTHEALIGEEPVTAGKIMDTMKFIGGKITEVSTGPDSVVCRVCWFSI